MPEGCDDCRVYTLQDLSKIKQMEEQVQQSQKMAAIGEIAAGIAHEFRNPLAAISGAAQVLCQNADSTSMHKGLLAIITRECGRLNENIEDFLLFSKPSPPEKDWASLATIIDESWDIIEKGFAEAHNYQIRTDIPENFDCWADQRQLKQIFINLFHNACIALGNEGGTLSVKAMEKTVNNTDIVHIEVVDNGCGIPEDKMEKIFLPFYTSRQNGTGLGLAIVKQITESHSGSIEATSTVGKGTTFTIQLPLP